MPKLAQDVVIDHEKGTVLIDGEPFPWHIPLTDIEVSISPEGVHRICLPMFFDGNFRVWGTPAQR